MVSRVEVEKAEQVTARRGVNDLIDSRQPEGILWALFVEIGVVDTHPPFIRVLFADENGVCKPLRMEDFFDEADRE
jgi:hypothetical protein